MLQKCPYVAFIKCILLNNCSLNGILYFFGVDVLLKFIWNVILTFINRKNRIYITTNMVTIHALDNEAV